MMYRQWVLQLVAWFSRRLPADDDPVNAAALAMALAGTFNVLAIGLVAQFEPFMPPYGSRLEIYGILGGAGAVLYAVHRAVIGEIAGPRPYSRPAEERARGWLRPTNVWVYLVVSMLLPIVAGFGMFWI